VSGHHSSGCERDAPAAQIPKKVGPRPSSYLAPRYATVTLSRTIPILPAQWFSWSPADSRLESGPERPLDGFFSLPDSLIRTGDVEIGPPEPAQYQGAARPGSRETTAFG
jgi:hypothetical protein